MILVDTGPLVALFDPADASHSRCAARLREIREPLVTTVPVLTEGFHLLAPNSPGATGLMDFVAAEALNARKVFTVDRKDFAIYRLRRGHRYLPFQVLD